MATIYEYDLNSFQGAEYRVLLQTADGKLTVYFAGQENGCILVIEESYSAAYGMGERFNRVNQKGLDVEVKVLEQFCNQGSVSYCPIPFFFTDRGTGIYVDTLTVTRFSFGENRISVEITGDGNGKLPKAYYFKGTPQEILDAFTNLTGKCAVVPKWSLGPWMSANRWNTEEEVYRQLSLMERYELPHTVMVVEAWSDEATFYRFNDHGEWPNPEIMVEKMRKKGVHLVLWQIPVFKKMENGKRHPVLDADWEYAVKNGLCLKHADGSAYTIPNGHWFSGSMLPDFTNPETVKWWFEKREYLLKLGVDGFKTDGGEFVYEDDVISANGLTGMELKNAFAAQYVKAYREFAGKDRVLFSRAGYVGQQKYPIQWAGDQMSTWEEFRHVMSAGVSSGLSGIPLWSFDIGGFAGPMPEKELYERAVQTAVFVPVMQWHSEPVGGQFAELYPSSNGENDRSPWNIALFYNDDDLIRRLRFWFNLRMNLVPYLYQQCLTAARTGTPVMKHLVIEYPQDTKVFDVEDCFMVGDLLVAPVMERGKAERTVYLPEGIWNSLWELAVQGTDGSFTEGMCRLQGGREYLIRCGREKIPVFLRDGGCLACNLDDTLRLGSAVGNSVTEYRNLCFYPVGNAGSFDFEDDLGNRICMRWEEEQCMEKREAGDVPYRILRTLT